MAIRRSRIERLPFAALRESRGVEAVWVTQITDWRFETGAGYPFVFDLDGSLYATRDQATLWRCRLDGEEKTARHRTVFDPGADRDPFESDDPFVWKGVNEVLTDQQIVTLVARNFGARLPR